MARDATQRPSAPNVALRLHQSDRLQPNQEQVVRLDLARSCVGWMTMARAAHLQECFGGKTVRAERQRQFWLRGTSTRRQDVFPARAVTALAGNVGDHCVLIKHFVATGRRLRRVAAYALAGLFCREFIAVGSK